MPPMGRFATRKPSARLRRGRLPADGLSFVAIERGRMVGTVRLWPIDAGSKHPALLARPARRRIRMRATAASARR